MKSIYKPSLFQIFKNKKYSKETLLKDLTAGLIVGILALPLAIAFGIASGVSPQQGLITAIIAGLLISLLGGTRFLIGGPTGAFIIIIVGIISQYGISGLTVATIMAGVILIVMGLCRLGVVFKFMPYPIVVGFTSGIALTLLTTQIKDFFGMSIDVPSGFIAQWGCYLTHLSAINWTELAASLTALLILVFWGRITKKIPGSLIALVVCTLASVMLNRFAGIQLATIGSKFPEMGGSMSLPRPEIPVVSFETLRTLITPAFTIALLAAIESLLAATVTDGVTGHRHDSNTELIGEGIANIITPIFGGIPATGAIARTMANINNGGKTPVAGIVHAVTLLLIYLFLMPYAVYVPLGCLAAILVMVAYNMSEWRTFRYLLKGDRQSVAVLLVTFFLTVVFDLTVAIEFGVLLAVILFVTRVMQTSGIEVLDADKVAASENLEPNPEDTEFLDIPRGVEVYEINGPFFFGLASKFEEFESRYKKDNKVRIIRMRKVPFIDATGVNNLRSLCERTSRRGIRIILSGVQPDVRRTLHQFGLDQVIGEEYILPHIVPALAKAREVLENTNK
ncbi:MAG: STAS domain-containing protein [Bacteroidales bacterium]|nr:STAS domain-containing protein [Bacteroidales bacterium]